MSSRTHSLGALHTDPQYDAVAVDGLYTAVLKVVLLDYVCEARFSQAAGYAPGGKAGGDKSKPPKERRERRERKSGHRLSAAPAEAMPPALVPALKARLNAVAMSKTRHDELTRRSLLRFYSHLLDPGFAAELARASVDVLVMRFVASANTEVVKLGSVDDVSAEVFRHTDAFVQIVISLVQREKNSDAVVAKLEEHRASLNPARSRPHSPPLAPAAPAAPATPPSFHLADLDHARVALLCALFAVDAAKLQADIDRLKPVVSQKALAKDVDQVVFYLDKDLALAPTHFSSADAYDSWKQRHHQMADSLRKRYPVPPPMKLIPPPPLPPGDEFYIMPPKSLTLPYFVVLAKLLLAHHRKEHGDSLGGPSDLSLFSNKSRDLLQTCARVWRMDASTMAVALYTAAHLAGLLLDPFFAANAKSLGPISLEWTTSVLQSCKRLVEDAGMDWEHKHMWSLKDQQQWAEQLANTYSEVFYSIKDCLGSVLSKTAKPKFGPYLAFLGEYVESDALFPQVRATGITAKWEKRLTKTLLRTAEVSYAERLASLPRDDTLSIVHVLEIADDLVGNIKLLQNRYKNPLLGFLNVAQSYASVVTGMFAADAENILRHIDAHVKSRGEFLNYGDALEAYKSMSEIRAIHEQVSPTAFKFDLENFFFVYLESWVSESNDKINEFVRNAFKEDKFEPIDIEDDDKKYSTSVHDIFTLIKHYSTILNGLGWRNEIQAAKVYTTFMGSISACCLFYASEISDIIMRDLSEESKDFKETRQTPGWFAEVKSIVNNIQLGNEKMDVEAFNFTPRTCIGLNNLSAMVNHLSKLERQLDPERVSATLLQSDPRPQYTSHVFSIRIVKAENLMSAPDNSVKPYVTLIDAQARRTVAKTRTLDSSNPEWDEEFEITLPANQTMTLSATVWEEKFGSHSVCGRALMQLEPRKFKHDGIPQEVYLDLDPQGRILVEIAVESEREDAVFAMGRAHRALKRSQQRITKMIVAKFSQFIKHCFSRSTLRAVCGNNGQNKPSQEQMDEAMMPLYNYLNMNLSVLAQHLAKELLVSVMLEAWNVVVASADELLLPKLTSSRALRFLGPSKRAVKQGWQSAVSSAVANVTSTLGQLGFGKTLTIHEVETVLGWLHFLCFDFFYNQGNGPAVHDLKNGQYQSLLLIPVYYDDATESLENEVESLSHAFLETLRGKNNMFVAHNDDTAKLRSRAGSIARSSTTRAHATARARDEIAREARELSSDPMVTKTLAENIILRLLLVRDDKAFVSRRLEQRERLAHTIATERLAKAAAEGTLFR